MANNNYPQITSVTSETLQAQIRNLLPSQEGFGTDLMAQNVIVPIIDLTSAAEGSTVPQNLQTAWGFETSHTSLLGTSATLISNTGFWLVDLNYTALTGSAATGGSLSISDGLSSKVIWEVNLSGSPSNLSVAAQQERFVVFLRAGDSLTGNSIAANFALDVVYRQIADINGTLVNPLGFNPQ